jgi:hypothetical protein
VKKAEEGVLRLVFTVERASSNPHL